MCARVDATSERGAADIVETASSVMERSPYNLYDIYHTKRSGGTAMAMPGKKPWPASSAGHLGQPKRVMEPDAIMDERRSVYRPRRRQRRA
jgi:hypothetical protein